LPENIRRYFFAKWLDKPGTGTSQLHIHIFGSRAVGYDLRSRLYCSGGGANLLN
jgi:hypothetical protein